VITFISYKHSDMVKIDQGSWSRLYQYNECVGLENWSSTPYHS